ncbi:hypothetical protein [Legionella septentrionalis]|uniref:hypothetical protein n=1 Tax=Legionella septentrionalis TaxID=2498109 RepID=UPI000F8E646A|nr:hypothetical protein [Legionella septentrionalis]RUR10214.1 hypothetical protein ELY14_06005 [Legionella septentrionalis]
MNQIINALLKPKQAGLTNKNKPAALIVLSPYDEGSHAIGFKDAESMVRDELGYGIINKKPLFFNSEDTEFSAAIKPVTLKNKSLTIWLSAHGASGWLFSGRRDANSELEATANFVEFVRRVETYTQCEVANIVLSACFTANEFVNVKDGTYFNSPARLLSFFLPEVNVLGFIGKNAESKVHVFKETTMGYLKETLNAEHASVLFKNGKPIESCFDNNTVPIYCNHEYTPDFILQALNYNFEDKNVEFYAPCLAAEFISKNNITLAAASLGQWQERRVRELTRNAQQEPHPSRLPSSSC